MHYEDSISESLKDISNQLNRISNNNYEIRNSLLSREILCYKGHNKLTQKDLVYKVENLFKNIKNDDAEVKTNIAEKMITFLLDDSKEVNKKINEALIKITSYYNELLNKNVEMNKDPTEMELNHRIFLQFILNNIFQYIEGMSKELIKEKIQIIPKIIKYAWEYQFDEYLSLGINPKKYKIFVNQNYELKKIEEIFIKEGFDNLKYSEIEKELFDLSTQPPINIDYKSMFLEKNFDKVLEKYKYKFKSKTLIEICKNNIDSKIIEYYHKYSSEDLMKKNHKEFRDCFFGLNKLIKKHPEL